MAVSGPGRAGLGDVSVRAVDVGRHPGFDRVVFRAQGDLPAWRVQYVPRVAKDGSGDPVPLDGNADLQLVFRGTSWTTTPSVQPALAPRYPALRQVAGAGEFEATLSYGIGQATRSGVRAYALTGPDRLVVDLAHPPGTPTGAAATRPAESGPTTTAPAGTPTEPPATGSTPTGPAGSATPAAPDSPAATDPADPAGFPDVATDDTSSGSGVTVPLAVGGGVLLLAALAGAAAYIRRRA